MDNERFQELALKKLEKLESLDKRQINLECDFKVMLNIMEKFSEKQDRLEKIVLRMENESMTKVRALFEKSDIHDDCLNDHESGLRP